MSLVRLKYKLSTLLMILFFLLSLFVVSPVVTSESYDSLVDANIEIEFITGTDFKITATLDVSEITVFGATYSSSSIHTISQSPLTDDIETMGAIKLMLRNSFEQQIEGSFENAIATASLEKPRYENSRFVDEYDVNITSEFFGLGDSINIYNLINGVLDMGAIVEYAFNFQAENGWNNTYSILLPDSMNFRNTNGTVNGNRIEWDIKNWNGGLSGIRGQLSIIYTNPTTPETQNDEINLSFELDAASVENTILNAIIFAEKIDISDYEMLPDFISNLDIITSDGLRLFVENGLTTWTDVYQNTISPLQNTIISKIEASKFNQTLDMVFSWDNQTTTDCSNPYNITNMNEKPAIKADLIDEDVNLKFLDISSKVLFGLANAGAKANISAEDFNFGDGLNEIGRPYVGMLILPNNITLDEENTYTWNQSNPVSGEITSDISPTYLNEEIDVSVNINIEKMDLHLPSFLTGKTRLTASTHSTENVDIYVTILPEEFTLPRKIELEYLNSDALRICIEEDVFSEEDVGNYLAAKKQLFETRISNVLNGLNISGFSDNEAFTDSLHWDGDISNMDEITPVVVSSYSDSLYSIPFNLSFYPFSFKIIDQEYRLSGLDDKSIVYRIQFPKGITVDATDTLGKSILLGETEDGHHYIEISFDANETQEIDFVTCCLSASTLYVVGLFLPCILSLVLIIILIVVILVIRKKKGKKKIVVREEKPEEATGYEGQDYYVPPPPSSK